MGVFSDYFSDARFIFYEFLNLYKVLNLFSDFTNSFLKIVLPIFKSWPLVLSEPISAVDLSLFKAQTI